MMGRHGRHVRKGGEVGARSVGLVCSRTHESKDSFGPVGDKGDCRRNCTKNDVGFYRTGVRFFVQLMIRNTRQNVAGPPFVGHCSEK